jgi:HlyD family secretion protein
MINPEASNKAVSLPYRKDKRRKSWLMGLMAAGLLGGAALSFAHARNQTPEIDPASLQTVMVESQDLKVQIKANGIVKAVRKTNLSPKEAGRIEELYVDEGTQVKKGTLIARMDNEEVQAQVKQYQAVLAKAKAELAKKQTGDRPEEIDKARAEVAENEAQVREARSQLALTRDRVKRRLTPAREGAISRDDLDQALTEERRARENLDRAIAGLAVAKHSLTLRLKGYRSEEIAQAEAEVAQAEAQLKYYQTQLSNTLVRAPFAGTITRRYAQQGDFVTPTTSASSSDGASSASIAELSSGVEVEAKIPESSIARIRPNQQVEVRSDAYDKTFQGRVRTIAPRAIREDNVTSFRVKVSLESGQNELKSGMNIKLTFLSDKIKDAVVVPLTAVVTKKNGQTGVYMPDREGHIKFREVVLGASSSTHAQVREGVNRGDRVLITPPPGQVIPGVDEGTKD